MARTKRLDTGHRKQCSWRWEPAIEEVVRAIASLTNRRPEDVANAILAQTLSKLNGKTCSNGSVAFRMPTIPQDVAFDVVESVKALESRQMAMPFLAEM